MDFAWKEILTKERQKPYFRQLEEFIASERQHHDVYPAPQDVFAAFEATPLHAVRVVILGQDPYHEAHQAHGLCFSVPMNIKIPPSLRNIFAELHADLGVTPSRHGCLTHWAHQGVLMLNTTLTVRGGQAKSHVGRGWETFTDNIISLLSAHSEPVIFVLWGSHAQTKRILITASHHAVITSAHPSPLSAYRGFFGSGPFSQINSALQSNGTSVIDWKLPAG
ncbi:MAG: uracil-DNA glycosylase [Ilumatobacteraceae bacterium]|nr:uracil-DNA glycosylase [Ilumatobacteraceae bacterium]